MYVKFFKRFFDIVLSFIALLVLLPFLLILTIIGTFAMHGNPFFVQERPGKNEKVFKMIKFRTMDNRRDETGELPPDEQRLNKYGICLRKTSCDELLELVNILRGDMSIVGPRPLLVKYLPRYSERQHRRHEILPGLTGYAQVNGRNSISWEKRFELDVWYVDNVSFKIDVKIIIDTVKIVLKREGVSSDTAATMEEFMGTSEKVSNKL